MRREANITMSELFPLPVDIAPDKLVSVIWLQNTIIVGLPSSMGCMFDYSSEGPKFEPQLDHITYADSS